MFDTSQPPCALRIVDAKRLRNAFTVDVEDYFQVSAFEPVVRKELWGSMPLRVEENTDRVLDLLAGHGIRATFFMLGWVAERAPGLVKRIVAAGHEVGSHGWDHTRATEQTPAEFKQDISRTKGFLEDLSGTPVIGYRAASFSIGAANLHTLDIIAQVGYRYSSSIYPVRHDLYGMPDAPRFAYRVARGDLLEIPITTVRICGRNIPCGGGGYFRLFPYRFSRWALRRVNSSENQAAVFYFHPWEVDPHQPRVDGISRKTRFRHYLNLDRMQKRLQRLLRDFAWDRMDTAFGMCKG